MTGFAQSAQAAPADAVAISVTAADVEAAALNVNGLTFKGFGILTANSTSALLLDYKAQHPAKYWELLETMFGGDYPIMNTIKIEMGNDRNTSTGPNPSTMRTRDEYPNVQREPGFQLAADAQHVAHGDVHVSILRWNRPVWVTTDESQYIWFKNTVLAAYREYGIMVDSINPDTNETTNPIASLYVKFSDWLRNDTLGYEGATGGDPNNGFASSTERNLYQSIKTIAADTVGIPPVSFGNAMTSATDSTLRDSVDVVGFHYATADDSAGNLKKLAEVFDKEIWNSEGQATFSNSADRPNNTNAYSGGVGTEFGGTGGPLEMSNWVTSGFEKSRRTLNIFQPAIGSFYDGFQYSSKELVSARDPWSGWLYYDGGLAALEQYSQFAKLGWENSDNSAGIWRGIPQASKTDLSGGNPPSGAQAGGVSYTTLAAPDKTDFSTVIVNDSPFVKTYKITPTGLDLSSNTMELWETRAADDGQAYNANWVVPVNEVAADQSGTYTVTVKPWSTLTATTLDHAHSVNGTLVARDGFGSTLPTSLEYADADGGRDVLDTDASGNTNGVTDDATLYADDFDYTDTPNIQRYNPTTGELSASTETFLDSRGAKAKPGSTPDVHVEDNGATPRYTNDTNGAFESVATTDPTHGRVLRQQVGPGMNGGAWNGGDPKTTIGDFRWANYRVSVDVLFETTGSAYATVGARQQGGTSNGQDVSAAELRIDPNGQWRFMRYGATLASGATSANPATSFRTGANVWNTLSVQVAGNVYTAYVNGVEVSSYTDPAPQSTGRIQLGSAFTFTQFDNLTVEKVAGYTPYYTNVIDGMHQTRWDDTSEAVLAFNNRWTHTNGQGMYEWQRTASKSTGAGATMTYTFTGTGLDILGTNSGNARLNVTVDGERVASSAPTWPAGSERTTFALRGLENGEHTVVLETATADEINIDAVGVIVANSDSSAVDISGLSTIVASAADLVESDWSVDTWPAFAVARAAAQAAVADPIAYGLDVEGATALEARLTAAMDQLEPQAVSPDVTDLGTISVTRAAGLPGTLSIADGSRSVVWGAGAARSFAATAELTTVQLTGRTAQKLQSTGLYQRFTATVLVTPGDLKYFIDTASTGSGATSAYGVVKAAQPGLLNDASDRRWNGTDASATWGWTTTAPGAPVAGTAADWRSSYVAADFSKPIVYSLTLPAGSYNVVTLQAPRAGLTTQIYSTVASGSYTNRITATSTGAATPVTQQVTLDAPGVVKVEFGTNGASGYNARLALVYVQAIPRDLGFQSALTLKSALPETVSVGGTSQAVTWDEGSADLPRTNFEPLVLSGTIGSGSDAQAIVARYEIVPAQLVYYIDSGTAGVDSPQYTAVKSTVPTLLNDKVDQVSTTEDQWGYVSTGMVLKSSTDRNNKYSTGMYQDTTQLIYRLPLEPGTYTLTGGFTEWWNVTRTMNHTVSAGGVELAKGNIALSGSSTPLSGDLTFTLTEAATVEYRVTNEGAGSEKPVISWVAVAAQADKSALIAEVATVEALVEADYTAASWAPLAAPLTAARAVLADNAATPADIAAAVTALADARSTLVSLVVLTSAVATAGALVESDYSPESWAPFAAALQAAAGVLAKPDATVAEVDAATIDLLAAQLELAPVAEVDTTVLEAALAVADSLEESDHTAGSWSAFSAARDAARALIAAPTARAANDATQEEVNQATADLLAAQEALVSIAALTAAVDTSQALIEDDFSAESWAVFASALDAAQVVLDDADATQDEVDAALLTLGEAIDQLEEFVYTAALAAAITAAEQRVESEYTPESWVAFAAALAAAQSTLADEESTQGQIDDAASALIAAQAGLVALTPEPVDVDLTALRAAIDSATPLASSAYTPQSWAAFAQALASANAVLADAEATQDQVDAARTALITAQGALVLVDTTLPAADPEGSDRPGLSTTGLEIGGSLALALMLLLGGLGAILVRYLPRKA